ncbi:hypothetical protein E2C01_000731 [Portunus trituberculatus]|uniref:Uncharacterized protein n=1 Tax=Portunus trituberculatus TaxID=210409 RepID=A0A5B7CFU4_PORTR|nr:hypothetical protein [Portunus trituberculatus]
MHQCLTATVWRDNNAAFRAQPPHEGVVAAPQLKNLTCTCEQEEDSLDDDQKKGQPYKGQTDPAKRGEGRRCLLLNHVPVCAASAKHYPANRFPP